MVRLARSDWALRVSIQLVTYLMGQGPRNISDDTSMFNSTAIYISQCVQFIIVSIYLVFSFSFSSFLLFLCTLQPNFLSRLIKCIIFPYYPLRRIQHTDQNQTT
jgi:hypothetical protein